MKNLRILSMDLGKKYIPIKDRNKKRFVTEFIDHEKYDVVMLQGNRISSNIDLNYLEDTHYSICSSSDKVVTLFNWNSIFSGTVVSSCYNAIILFLDGEKVPFINVNCQTKMDFDCVYNTCKQFTDSNINFLITGRFPRKIDTNEFCDMFDLEDISSNVAVDSYVQYNREMLNHFFISKKIESGGVHKLVGMSEVAKIGKAYPMEVSLSYKKVWK